MVGLRRDLYKHPENCIGRYKRDDMKNDGERLAVGHCFQFLYMQNSRKNAKIKITKLIKINDMF